MKIAQIVGVYGLTLAILGASNPASAVTLNTAVSSIYQVGSTQVVHIGHTAMASTVYNRLFAGGTYKVACALPGTLPVEGQRFLSAEGLGSRLVLNVTIPAVQPAYISVPGFNLLTRGEMMACVYNWTSRAVESNYSIGAGGIGFTTGGGEQSEGSAEVFNMRVPGLPSSDDWTVCTP